MKKIYLAEVPDEQAVDKYIMSTTGSRDKWLMIRDSYLKKMVLKINDYDHNRLTVDTQACIEKFGFQGWTHNDLNNTRAKDPGTDQYAWRQQLHDRPYDSTASVMRAHRGQ